MKVIIQAAEGVRGKQFQRVADPAHWDDLWADIPADYSQAETGHLPRQLRATFRKLVAPPARVLEAGCGQGHFTVALSHLGYDAVGIDWADRVIGRNQQRFPQIPFRQGDVRSIADPDNSYDAVYSPGVCEHFEEGPDDVLREVVRVLKPGGVAVVSTPCLNKLRQRRWSRVIGSDPGAFYQYFFTPEGMSHILSRLGLVEVRAYPYGVWAALCDELPVLRRLPLGRSAGVLDLIPGLRQLGSTCIWVGRKST